MTVPSPRNPRSDGEWFNLLKKSLRNILNAAGEVGSALFQVVWPPVVLAWVAAKRFVTAHPKVMVAIAILIVGVLLVHPLAQGVVRLLGFGEHGVHAGSIAARMQAALHGGFVPKGSIFASLQSFGAL